MDDRDALLWNAPPPPPRTFKPNEPLFVLCQGQRQIVFELRDHGDGGVEVQMFRDGEFYAGRRFDTREQASAYAELIRGKLEPAGWSLGER